MLRIIILGVLTLAVSMTADAQIVGRYLMLDISSMHDLVDAQSLALGETMAARVGNSLAWSSNPATLARAMGAGADYGYRFPGNSDFSLVTAGAWINSPAGTFALHYSNYDMGEIKPTFGNDSDKADHLYDETYALSYAQTLFTSLSVGATIKQFTRVVPYSSSTSIENSQVYVDLGAIFSMGGFVHKAYSYDSIHIGASVQHLGGEFEYITVAQSVDVASLLRIGALYTMTISGADEEVPRMRLSASFEHRRTINPIEQYPRRFDYSALGSEVMLYEMLSLRGGVMVFPENTIRNESGEVVFRYGFGFQLPLRKVGLDIPISVGFDYAGIPTTIDVVSGAQQGARSAFDIRVFYNGALFN